jgi:acylaminoacyl-peptidase
MAPKSDNSIAEVPANAEAEARLLEEFTRVPILTRATVRADDSGNVHLTVATAQHNLPANSKRQTQRSAVVPAAAIASSSSSLAASALVSPLPAEPAASVLTSVSPSGKRMLVARTHAGGGSGNGGGGGGDSGGAGGGVLLELWEGGRMVKELLAPKALHGAIVNDNWFSRGAAWSPDETRVCYVAEAPPTQRTPQWGSSEKKDEGGSSGGKSAAAPPASSAATPRGWRGVGEAEEDWGELNTGKRPPALFVLDTRDWSVRSLPTGVTPGSDASEHHSCGQPAWTPDGRGVVFVAWPHAPPNFPATKRRLGIVFCYNRPCALYYAEPAKQGEGGAKDAAAAAATAVAARVSPPCLQSAATPMFTPDGSRLLFFSHEAAASSGVHNATAALHSVEWKGAEKAAAAAAASSSPPAALVPVVRRPASPGAFPGLYPSLPVDNPFVERGPGKQPYLLLTSQWGSMTAVVAVDLDTGAVSAAVGGGGEGGGNGNGAPPPDASLGSWAFQGAAAGVAVALHSSPRQPPRLMAARVAAAADAPPPSSWRWQELAALSPDLSALPRVQRALAVLETRVSRVPQSYLTGDAALAVESIVTGPKEAFYAGAGGGGGGAAAAAAAGAKAAGATGAAARAPAILFPHGGPHAATPSAYYMPAAFFGSLGYLFVAVNYRGSVGFGEDAVQSLPGKVGEQDVADCLAALDCLCREGGGAVAAADAQRCAVIGGSHGGFLAGHLIGKHPARFRAAGLRNPVLNIALMVGVTDIPDWCYVEAFGSGGGGGSGAAQSGGGGDKGQSVGGLARYSAAPTADDLRAFLDKSPARWLDRVTTPVAVLLGAKDRRVPAEDGKRWVAALRSRQSPPPPPTRMLVFPEDTHALDRPQTEFEQWVSLAAWLREHGTWSGVGLDDEKDEA